MMASINPLGERARGNRWWRTAGAFVVGTALGGAALGTVTGATGQLVAAAVTAPVTLLTLVVIILVLAAGVVELTAWPVPTLHRQVDEAWLGRYRGWVYGAGFGAQLGTGVATTVTTAAVYAMVAMGVVLGAGGQAESAAVLGVAFGLVRAVPVLAAATLREPDRLRNRAAQGAAIASAWRVVTGCCLCVLAAWLVASL